MKHLILATVLLFSVSALGWTRELKPSEQPLVGVWIWIETTDCSGEMELFADGTGRGVLGDSFQWQILPDGRFKADTPSEGSVKITTSDSVDLQQGIMRMNNRDFRRSTPQIAGICSELRQASAAVSSAYESRRSAGDRLQAAESRWRCAAARGWGWGDCSTEKIGQYLKSFREYMESAEKSLRSCRQHAEAAITQWPTFPQAYDSQERCIFAMLELLDDWRLLPDYDPDLEKLRNLEPRLAEIQHRSDSKRDAAEVRKQVKDLRAALDKQRAEIEGKLAQMAPPLEEIETKRVAVIESLLDSFRRKMNAAPPDRKAFMLASLAWVHAISTRPQLSDGAQALNYARQAVAMEPRSSEFATVLAAAYARTGDFPEARRAQEQAIALTNANPNCESWRTWQRAVLDVYRQGKLVTDEGTNLFPFGREQSEWWGHNRDDWYGPFTRVDSFEGCRS